jgi:hypothetical protein
MDDIEFHIMTDIPDKEHPVDNFSKTVIVYELTRETKEVQDFALGYYNFNTKSWFLNDGESLEASLWSYLPMPTGMKNRHFKTINID